MTNFAFYYIEANIVCVIVFAIILMHNRFNIDRQEKQVKFDLALEAFIAYFLTDCLWAAIEGGLIPKTRLTVVVSCFFLYLFMSSIIYFWLDYVLSYEQAPHRNRPINRFAVEFPYIISTVALILNYINAPQMLLDDELETTPAFNVYLVAVPYIYMAAILFYTIRKARKTENKAEKRNHLLVGFFPLMTIAGGLIEMLFLPEMPIFCFTSMILMLVFYIRSIEFRVSLDPLTNLNNRGQLERYCSQKSNIMPDERKTVVVMMDIDWFKSINDNYGHTEGDNSLVLVANAMKKVISNHSMPSFLCRYGGDEFILIAHPYEMKEIDGLISEMRDEINRQSTKYPVSVSAGYDEFVGGEDTIQLCIQRADKKLYEDKKNRKKSLKTYYESHKKVLLT